MPESRKYMRVAIPADKVKAFEDAKKRAEDSAMIKLTDTQYASRLIQWALEQQDKSG